MNISIFGLGYVGCVSMGCLAQLGHKVIGVDLSNHKVDQINDGHATIIEKDIDDIIAKQHTQRNIEATVDTSYAIENSDISIICVGTPSTDEGHLNLRAIYSVAEDIAISIANKNQFHVIAIRSTVLPGTCEKVSEIISNKSDKQLDEDFAVVSNPEFLREGSAVFDYFHPPYTLVGTENQMAQSIMGEIFKDIDAEIIFTTLRTAEIMKYVSNSFHALKVAFGNEIGNICKKININSHDVMDIFIKDTQLNISPYYLKPGFAYGGSCLPKDLKALQTLSHDLYLNTPVIDAIDKSNIIQVERAKQILDQYKAKKIAVLGISFKVGTDDLRNSPVISIIEYLIGKGCSMKIFDNNINSAILFGANREYIEQHISHFQELLYDNLNDTLKDTEMVIIGNNDQCYINVLDNYDGQIFDLARLSKKIMNKAQYFGINW